MEKVQGKNSAFGSEFWGICCESGKKYSQTVRKKFHLTMAALDPTVTNTSRYISLLVERGGCQYLLCSLVPGSILQVNLNLIFERGEVVTFSLQGKGTVHLSGYHIFEEGDPSIPNDSSKSPDSDPIKNNIGAVDDETSDEEEESSNEEEESSDEDDDELEEEEEEEEEIVIVKAKKKVAKIAQNALNSAKKALTPQATPNRKKDGASQAITPKGNAVNKMSKRTREESSDEEDESSDDELHEAPTKQSPKEVQSSKKQKINVLTPVVGKKPGNQNTPKHFADVINLEDNTVKTTPKSLKSPGFLDSSIGRTPMPKPISKAKRDEESSDDDSDEMDTSMGNKLMQSPSNQQNANTESKKKKKKKKAAANDCKTLGNTPTKVDKCSPTKKLLGGLECEDIRVGHGLEAKRGKLCHVFYTGKLGNNKVFDARLPGSKPFSFRLGTGQVIKGWDVGVEGMKVGGKRKLTVPPELAYKNQQMGVVPPSSTLYFVVELKAVS